MNRLTVSSVVVLIIISSEFGISQEKNSPLLSQAKQSQKPDSGNAKTEKTAPKVDNAKGSDRSNSNLDFRTKSADGSNWLTREEISEGWIRLFDGQTLFGWKPNNKLGWSVKNGVITADSSDAANQGLLVSTTRFADYELRCDYRVEKGGNSGIFLRTPN